MYGNIIQGFFTRSANWPMGAAMAMVMLVADARSWWPIALRVVDLRRVAA